MHPVYIDHPWDVSTTWPRACLPLSTSLTLTRFRASDRPDTVPACCSVPYWLCPGLRTSVCLWPVFACPLFGSINMSDSSCLHLGLILSSDNNNICHDLKIESALGETAPHFGVHCPPQHFCSNYFSGLNGGEVCWAEWSKLKIAVHIVLFASPAMMSEGCLQ